MVAKRTADKKIGTFNSLYLVAMQKKIPLKSEVCVRISSPESPWINGFFGLDHLVRLGSATQVKFEATRARHNIWRMHCL